MSRDPRKKERQRLKRKQKKLKMRRENSRTILQRIASEGGTLECWINPGWREQGMAAILVLGQLHGRFACAMFLLDVWCVGLKDAWGRPEIGEAEFHDELLQSWLEQYDGKRISPADAAKFVAAGIRFSRQNGFRLPPHWDRWVSIFGKSLPEPKTADLADFGVEGKLRYWGDMDFLRKRLIACTPQEFIDRPDVEWVMSSASPFEFADFDSEGEDDELDEDAEVTEEMFGMLERMSERLDDAVRKWCFSKGIAPHPKLKDGASLLLAATLPLAAETEDDADAKNVDMSPANELAAELLLRFPESDREAILDAGQQIQMYMASFPTPEAAINAIQLD